MTLRLPVVSRVLAGTLGVWTFAFAFAAAGIAGLTAAGVDHAESTSLVNMLALLLLLVGHVWAFAARRLAVVWATLAGGAATMGVAAWLAARALAG